MDRPTKTEGCCLRASQAATQGEDRRRGFSVWAACCTSGSFSYPPGEAGRAESH